MQERDVEQEPINDEEVCALDPFDDPVVGPQLRKWAETRGEKPLYVVRKHGKVTYISNSQYGGTLTRIVPKVGRNDPCPCGSGKKYKHCCLV